MSARITMTGFVDVVDTLKRPFRNTGFAFSGLSTRSVDNPLASPTSTSVSSGTLASRASSLRARLAWILSLRA